MSAEIFITKYKAQLQALLPSSEVEYELSTENPIKFTDSENVKLSFAAIADTHFSKKEYLAHNVENCFKDIFNSGEKFDALLMAGDIAELGKKGEYKRFFQVFDTYKDKLKLFITMGNHDVRLQYGRNQKIIMNKVNEYLNIDTNRKSYYSYDVNAHIVIYM